MKWQVPYRAVVVFSIVIFFCVACSQVSRKVQEIPSSANSSKTPSSPQTIANLPMQDVSLATQISSNNLYGEIIENVSVDKTSFNASYGKEVKLTIKLIKKARLRVQVYDSDWGLVQEIFAVDNDYLNSGLQQLTWLGRDMDDNIVPDEAYFFVIHAEDENGNTEVYDPTVFSGGEVRDITDVDIRPESGTINYRMQEMGRTLIRIGTTSGPMLHTLVDWKPRVKGSITEYWDGKDNDDLVELFYHDNFRMLVTYFTLPDNSVIAYGNKNLSYRQYKQTVAIGRSKKEDRGTNVIGQSPHYGMNRLEDHAPNVKMKIIGAKTNKDGIPIISKRTLVRVELEDEEKHYFQNSQFEIVFFLDLKFFSEDESGYSPFNWAWDLSGVAPGEHLLTVNISGFKDQVGVKSQRIIVE